MSRTPDSASPMLNGPLSERTNASMTFDGTRRPKIARVRPPSFDRARRAFAESLEELDAGDILESTSVADVSFPPEPVPAVERPVRQALPSFPDDAPAWNGNANISSIAPISLELAPPPAPDLRGSLGSFGEFDMQNVAGIPRRATWRTAAFFATAATLAIASFLAVMTLQPHDESHAVSPRFPHTVQVLAAHEAMILPVASGPSKAIEDIVEEVHTEPQRPTRSLRRASASRGVLRFAPSVRGVLIDGTPHRVERGVLRVPCGTHRIKTPSQPAREIEIACAGTAM